MAGVFKYAYAHPPFNFLGRFTASQWAAFQSWVAARKDNFTDISLFYQIRAQQLRKTAGILEQYYSTSNDQPLSPSFSKEIWKPGPDGHFAYPNNDDHVPMVMMSRIKARFKEMLQRDEEGVFYMNQVRCLIEKNEDAAQYSHDFIQAPNQQSNTGSVPDNPQTLQSLLDKINGLFSKPEYVSVLVDDVNTANFYKGQPYYRVHQADPPTPWELYLMNHSDESTPIAIKEQGAVES
jgi:hypothetical protein